MAFTVKWHVMLCSEHCMSVLSWRRITVNEGLWLADSSMSSERGPVIGCWRMTWIPSVSTRLIHSSFHLFTSLTFFLQLNSRRGLAERSRCCSPCHHFHIFYPHEFICKCMMNIDWVLAVVLTDRVTDSSLLFLPQPIYGAHSGTWLARAGLADLWLVEPQPRSVWWLAEREERGGAWAGRPTATGQTLSLSFSLSLSHTLRVYICI